MKFKSTLNLATLAELIKRMQRQPIKPLEWVIFLRQFATLMSASISLLKSCDILIASQRNPHLITLAKQIKQDTAAGNSLYDSVKAFPQVFDHLTCEMIYIGEQTGKLDFTFTQIAEHHEIQLRMRQKIKQALFYPIIVLITALLVSAALMIFIIPKFAALFQASYQKLPFYTQMIFSFAQFLNNNLGWIMVFNIVGSLLMTYLIKQHHQTLRRQLYSLPFFTVVKTNVILSRFCRHLTLSLSAGIPMIKALQLTAKVNQDPTFSRVLARVRSQVHTGIELNVALAKHSFFPILMVQMIKIGEESGLLEEMLIKVADFFEADIDQFAATISQTIEPLIILLLGALIGGLVIAMYLPIFKLGTVI